MRCFRVTGNILNQILHFIICGYISILKPYVYMMFLLIGISEQEVLDILCACVPGSGFGYIFRFCAKLLSNYQSSKVSKLLIISDKN